MSGRRVHPGSGRVYHVEYNPPKDPGVDDETGEALMQRDDDKEETVRDRLRVYHEQTSPLSAFYRQRGERSALTFITVDGLGDVEAVQKRILSGLSS